MPSPWPRDLVRIPDEPWVHADVESLAMKYDRVDAHGWYANLDRTVGTLDGLLDDGDILVDYSGGTGILVGRLLAARPGARFGVVEVDSSPKFLRLALEKYRHDERVAFRLLRYLKDKKRLQYVDEVLGPTLAHGMVDALVSANAVHLYQDLDATLKAWRRILEPGGRIHVQSGNVRTSAGPKHAWIIDDTVHAVHDEALALAREDARFAAWKSAAGDAPRLVQYDHQRRKFFPDVRPLETYLAALEGAGFRVLAVETEPIEASADEWLQFLSVYHEGVLGWVGGSEKVEGRAPAPEAVADRLALMRAAFERVLDGKPTFTATWTYVDAEAA